MASMVRTALNRVVALGIGREIQGVRPSARRLNIYLKGELANEAIDSCAARCLTVGGSRLFLRSLLAL